jgi:hypothetical protein
MLVLRPSFVFHQKLSEFYDDACSFAYDDVVGGKSVPTVKYL